MKYGMADAIARPGYRWAVCLGAGLVLMIPLLVAEVPPLLDYPNHLARTYVLAFGAHDPVLSHMYAQQWQVVPNLAVDLMLTRLMHVLPVHVAGRVMLGLILLLNYAAIILYSRSVFGRWSWWPLAGALMGYHALFLTGFMNFQIGIALGMLTAAGWNSWRERYPHSTVALTTLAATQVFFAHIFGLVFCGVLIGSREFVISGRNWRSGSRGAVLWRGAALALVFLPSAVLYLWAELSQADDEPVVWLTLYQKLENLAEPFMNYCAAFDRLTAVAIMFFILTCLLVRQIRVHPASALAGLICLSIYLVAPATLKGASFIDARFPIMLGMLLFAGTLPRLPAGPAQLVALALAALFVVRMGVVIAVWAGQGRDIADIRASIAPVEPGSRVLVVTVDPDSNPSFWQLQGRRLTIAGFCRTDHHLGSLLTIERHAFWPLIFTRRSHQPLRVLPPYDVLSEPAGYPRDYQLLDPTVKPLRDVVRPSYMANWPETFDFVLLLNAGGATELPSFVADRLQPINRSSMAALYRVRRPPIPTSLDKRLNAK